MIDIIGTLRLLYRRVNQLFDFAVAHLQLTETGGTLTSDGTEQTIYENNNPMGVYKPVKVQIDFTNQTGLETTVVRTYYRIESGGAYVGKDKRTFEGGMDAGMDENNLVNIELEPNRFGVRVTLERTAGGAQNYPWCVFTEG